MPEKPRHYDKKVKNAQEAHEAIRPAGDRFRTPDQVASELAERGLVRGGTDVTGYGLLGHLGSLCRSSGVGAEIGASAVPVMSEDEFKLMAEDCIPGGSRENLKTANTFTNWNRVSVAQKHLLADAQTSGGLLLCVRPRLLQQVLKVLKRYRTPCAIVIGRIVRSTESRVRIDQ